MTIEQAAKYYVFEPLGMCNSTFEYAKTVTPYMNLSSVVLYTFSVFIIAFIELFLIFSVIIRITKYSFCSFKSGFVFCFIVAGIVNTLFLLFVFVSKVVIIFGVYFVFSGLFLLCAKRNNYSNILILTISILVLGFTIPVSIPVTHDFVVKEANCAYTLKSTSEDMAIFCQELISQYSSGDGVMKDMFSVAVNIDTGNAWGLGIAIESENVGETYWHSGINPGFQSLFVLYPSQDKYIVILTSNDNGLTFAKDIARTFFGIDGCWDIKR